MRRSIPSALLCLCLTPILCPYSSAQQEQSEGKRKVVSKVVPVYPQIARAMKLSGIVKMAAVVTPSGTVKSAEVLGGHPLLAQAAAEIVRRWKWEPAAQETRELVEIRFRPD